MGQNETRPRRATTVALLLASAGAIAGGLAAPGYGVVLFPVSTVLAVGAFVAAWRARGRISHGTD
jgi:uncharacterized RDD family membrane protein YckC